MNGEEIKAQVCTILHAAGICYERVDHPAAFTMEDLDQMGLPHLETIAKNLFLRDSSGKHHFLVVVDGHRTVDLKALKTAIGSSRLSFASDERLEKHLACYGYFGIAFTKEWGMSKRIQQVQYINPASDLRRDYTAAFNLALKNAGTSCSETERRIKGLMLHLLMYLKPYSGEFENRVEGKVEDRCFTDECEWRYVPNLEASDFPPLYFDDSLIRIGVPNDMSNAMAREPELALSFDYSEVKHIIVPSREEFRKLTAVIEALPVDNSVKYDLISKVIVWDEDKGDF